MTALADSVRSALRGGAELYADDAATAQWLRGHLHRVDEPLRVAVAGKVKAGKSTLLNALVGEEIAATDAGECTRVVTEYRDGPAPSVVLRPVSGPAQPLPVRRESGRLRLDLHGVPPEDVERLVVDWPSRGLRSTTLLDTPGIGSLSTATSARTTTLLVPEDDSPSDADAVVYLMRHLHATDVRFLEAFQDRGVARATPVSTIAVLSRADEIGAGRIDALMSAQQVARRYRTEPALRPLCQTVVAVAGLLAQTGRTLRQAEHTALAELAAAPRADVEALLLSADRFTRPDAPSTLPADVRAGLLARFGIFGVRLATTLVRRGFGEAPALAAELVRRSGLPELTDVLDRQFTERRDLLKARSALLALDQVLRTDPRPGSAALAADVERITASTHEFAELRLLADLRAGRVRLPADLVGETERLLGGGGTRPAARLGADDTAGPDELRAAALATLGGWQRRAESPLAGRATTDAARVVIRSVEGLLAVLPR